ncbi:MAG: hypothetical protein A2W35_11365 [Chloroflexi bacterium RBG_16_57_11]|nr:MAG: hypothetical protein A2W35_11365 [Chloroflexi bacterium RBG_16_57_11]
MKRKIILLTLVVSLLLAPAAQAMSSDNYALDWMVPLTSGGGGSAVSIHYAANYSVGQTSVGEASSVSYAVRLGFWQHFVDSIRLWLPVVFRY